MFTHIFSQCVIVFFSVAIDNPNPNDFGSVWSEMCGHAFVRVRVWCFLICLCSNLCPCPSWVLLWSLWKSCPKLGLLHSEIEIFTVRACDHAHVRVRPSLDLGYFLGNNQFMLWIFNKGTLKGTFSLQTTSLSTITHITPYYPIFRES